MLTGLFYAAAVAQVLGVFMFCINMAATLATAPALPVHKPATATQDPSPASVPTRPARTAASPLTPDSPVAHWVDRKAGARELLVAAGLRPVADPQHMEMVRKIGVSLSHACTKHGMPLDDVVARLSALPDKPWNPSPAGSQGLSMAPAGGGGCAAPKEITPDTVIGAMVDAYPETAPVLERRFGSGCFTCPGFATETLTQGAMMHGADVHQLVSELKAVTEK
jgi:hybrid cluster-associated redox disulfide protein